MKISKKSFLVILALALFASACGDSGATRDEQGEIVEEGGVSAFSMQVGDCVLEPDSEQIGSLDAVPCDQPHDFEVYALFDMTNGDWPGQDVVDAAVEERCPILYEEAIGISYLESAYYFQAIYPTIDSWINGNDREIVCVVFEPEAQITGSLLGSGK